MKHFKKLKIASAISLSTLAIPVQAVMQLTGDVQLADKIYSEALQWTPDVSDDVLALSNVTIETDVDGIPGVSANMLNKNDIFISDSIIGSNKTGVHVGSSQDSTVNIKDSEINVGLGTLGQTFGVVLIGENSTLNIERSNITTYGGSAGTYAVHLLNSNASTVNISDSEITAHIEVANSEEVPSQHSTALYIHMTNDSIANLTNTTLNGNIWLTRLAYDNTVNVLGSRMVGNLLLTSQSDETAKLNHHTVNFDDSYLDGSIRFTAKGDGTLYKQDSQVNFTNGSHWKAAATSNIENISIIDSTIDITKATVNADNWYSKSSDLLVSGDSWLNITTGTGDMNVVIKSDGRGDGYDNREIINVANGDIAIAANEADLGAYKYKLVEQEGRWSLVRMVDDGSTDGSTDGSNGGDGGDGSHGGDGSNGGDGSHGGNGGNFVLSNSANAVLSSLAAPLASWNTQVNTVYDRLNSRMDSEGRNLWANYYGGTWAGEAELSSSFKQNINGLAMGVDKTLPISSGQATYGAAIMHDNSHLSDFDNRGSGGSTESTSVQAYGLLAMDNGMFYKGTVSAGQSRSRVHANSSDGAVSRGNYTQNLLGLTGQAGYRYQVTQDVYVAPYAQMNGYTASGADFSLDNGMQVNSDRYWSARGELGMEAGVKTQIAGMAVTPHVMMATGHEFVKDNDVGINGEAFSNSVDGSGYKFGGGVEAQLMKDLSAGVNVNYSRNRDIEQRFGVTAGVRYSF
ncbi:autotransporter outer membrane beta-barrel domain-containing protein [Budvicia aquatica]|uniref:autotransporter outer membrane beta-barrel domain-containing protein n=1 Tax=Budvicia aquatica TaxID=82979 RepID=UPI00141B9FD1|nr:autotransporter outer membrane beta-barrel domain-containing protein [Budvicia aquatica]